MSADPTREILSPAQRRLVGFALGFAALLAIAAGIIGAFVVLGRLVQFFSGVLWPLAVAGVLAVVLRPLVAALEARIGHRRLAAVIILYGVFLLVVAALLAKVVPPLVGQLLDFVAYLGPLQADIGGYFSERYPEWVESGRRLMANPMVQRIVSALSTEAQSLATEIMPSLRAAGGGVVGGFAAVAQAVVIPVYLFFFLLSRGEPTGKLADQLPFLKPGLRDDIVFLVREFIAIVESFFRGQLIIGLSMGVLFALGFSLIGLKFGLFIGLSLGILNIVPYLGTILGLAVALPLAFFQPEGGWYLVGLVLLVNALVQSIEAWVLTPKIMGDRTGLHPVAIMVAIFFWGTAFGGILGMLLAIPLTAFFVTAWRLARRKYFRAEPAAPAAP